MGWLTKWGGMWGMIPQTTGSIYFVAAGATYTVEGRTYSSSDDNDGLSPERAKRTIQAAVDLAVGNDVVVCLPGAHTVATTSVAMDTAGVTLMGLPVFGSPNLSRTTVTTSITADEIINVTAANCQIAYLRFIPITAAAAIDVSAAGDNLWVHHCSFDMETPAANTATIGVSSVGASADRMLVEDCFFESDGAQGAGIALSGSTNFSVRRNRFNVDAGTWAAALTMVAQEPSGWIENNGFFTTHNGGITDAINGAELVITNSVAIAYNIFSPGCVASVIDTFGTTDAYLGENYLMGAGAGAGGSIIATIT